jgi:hypothetical protein
MLTPPVVVREARVVDDEAPLPRWRKSALLYDTAAACEAVRSRWVSALRRSEGSLRFARASNTRCVAAADPRLIPGSGPVPGQSGWYLLVPPAGGCGAAAPGAGAPPTPCEPADPPPPLVAWRQQRSFDTEAECVAARGEMSAAAGRASAECVAVGDRRLAPGGAP